MIYKYARIAELEIELSQWLGNADYDAVKLIAHKHKRLSSLCARALLYKSLFQETGVRGWSVKKDPKGKPFLVHEDIVHIPHISISHSRSLVAIVISFKGTVGIDIEDWQARDIGAIAKAFHRRGGHHALCPFAPFRLALRQHTQMGDLG